MTHLIEILTAIVLSGTIIGGEIKAISKLTKIADSVERLSASMEHVVVQIGDHETRLTRVEDRFADLHDDVRAGRKGADSSAVAAPRRRTRAGSGTAT
jgi:hypothetical protein